MHNHLPPAPPFQPANNTWLVRGGIISLFIYAGFWLLDKDISATGEALMVLFFLLAMFSGKGRILLREPLPYLFLAWLLFQTAIYLWSSSHFPELRSDHIVEARILSNVFLFIIVAWWLGGDTRRIVVVLVLSITGYLLGSIFQNGGLLDELGKIRRFQRIDLGYNNSGHTAVYSAFVFLTLLTLRRRIATYLPEKLRLPARLLLLLALVYALAMVLLTQTRATWLGLTITLVALGIGIAFKTLRGMRSAQERGQTLPHKSLFTLMIVVAISAIAITTLNIDKLIIKRIDKESEVIEKLAEGDIKHIKLSSIGIRIKIWTMGSEWFAERPLFGWGPQSRKALFWQGDQPLWMKKKIRHLHNSYLELLVAYGITGFMLFLGLFLYIWYRSWQGWRKGAIPDDIMLFATLWTVYWLLVNIFESYLIYSATGPYLNALVGGMLYSYHLRQIAQRPLSKG